MICVSLLAFRLLFFSLWVEISWFLSKNFLLYTAYPTKRVSVFCCCFLVLYSAALSATPIIIIFQRCVPEVPMRCLLKVHFVHWSQKWDLCTLARCNMFILQHYEAQVWRSGTYAKSLTSSWETGGVMNCLLKISCFKCLFQINLHQCHLVFFF